jgi:hypothetical protein
MTTATVKGKWIDELVESIGQFVKMETSDGMEREGRLSGLKSRTLKWEGDEVEIVTELELNGDPYDSVPLDRITTLDLI